MWRQPDGASSTGNSTLAFCAVLIWVKPFLDHTTNNHRHWPQHESPGFRDPQRWQAGCTRSPVAIRLSRNALQAARFNLAALSDDPYLELELGLLKEFGICVGDSSRTAGPSCAPLEDLPFSCFQDRATQSSCWRPVTVK